LEVRITDDRVVRCDALRLLDVPGPALMVAGRIDGEPDDLRVAAVELGLDPGHVAQLGGADGGEVLRVREQHRPGIPDPVMEADPPLRRLRLEIRRRVAQLETHLYLRFEFGLSRRNESAGRRILEYGRLRILRGRGSLSDEAG